MPLATDLCGAASRIHWNLIISIAKTGSDMKDSLHGLKVIDFTQIVAGPTCTMMLADRGADVIKIESLKGDLSRQLGPWKNGESIMFSSMNRNKRSVVLDLKKVEHVDAAERLSLIHI